MPFEAVMTRSNGNTTAWTNYTGLTKREMMAMHMMAANRSRQSSYRSWEAMATDAVEAADALLVELGRTPNHFPDAAKMVAHEGWQLVPVKPTCQMLDAVMAPKGVTIDGYPNPHTISDKYSAMLAAAPKPKDE